jgi:hypothetical protein
MANALNSIPSLRRNLMAPDSFSSLFPPTGSDLFDIFLASLLDCADLSSQFIGSPVEGPAVMSLERSVRLAGPAKGILVVRAHRKLGALLFEKSIHGQDHWDSREAAFDYLAQLFAEKLVRAYWSLGEFEPLVTNICNPQFWPPRAPVSSGAILVEHYPVEIRLWMDEAPPSNQGDLL